MIRVQHVVKRFGEFTAVNDISFDVHKGEIFAFLGPNGAGKTTTIRMLTTLLQPTSGTMQLNGLDPTVQKEEARRHFGIVFQDPSLDQDLTARENMELHGVLYHVPRKERRERIEMLLRLFDLWDRRDTVVKQFSGGMKRRLEIARGLLHTPKILFLDEPTASLDPDIADKIRGVLKEVRRSTGLSILYTSHNMKEMEEMSDRIIFLQRGKIVAQGTAQEIIERFGQQDLEEVFLKLAREK